MKKIIKTYQTLRGAPKRYTLTIDSRKPLTREIRELVLVLDEQLSELTEWKLPKRKALTK